MKEKIYIIFILLAITLRLSAQFPPAAGETGSTAIGKDDPSFVGWAKSCVAKRGFINITDTTITFTQNNVTSNRAFFGNETMATGKPGGVLDCISLGDGGSATLTFDFPIRNGAGADFAVFENALKMQEAPFQYFCELAFVEVSTNGKRFVRFPAVSNTPFQTQIQSFGQIDPTQIHNFAGKYVFNFGTPFDLDDIKDSTGINPDSINFVRLIDVGGTINPKYASYDSKGNIVNDPFPTEFWNCGFDLDAVGAIHMNGITGITQTQKQTSFSIYPNPISRGQSLHLQSIEPNASFSNIELCSLTGEIIKTWKNESPGQLNLTLPEQTKGLYLLRIRSGKQTETIKLMVE